MVRSYEMMAIIDTAVEDHSVEVKAIEEVIVKHGGEVTKTDVWGKRRFAYEIDKKTEGIYVVYEYKVSPDQLSEIDRLLGLRPMVVRHMSISLEEK
ncbi:MAG: 30S ribosomal protein S6 [Pyramidobacter sp.]|nr:30S ribosomal protein S6 [Pyramidobacter sp.]